MGNIEKTLDSMKSIAIAALLGSADAHFFKRLFHQKHHAAELMTDADYKFMQHVVEFGKSYGTKEEYEFRSALFKQNLKEIDAINADPNTTHVVAVNEFSTWTAQERKTLTGYKQINDGL